MKINRTLYSTFLMMALLFLSVSAALSYTSFRYDHIVVDAPAPRNDVAIRVTVEVTNTGDREGDEVAQLYLRENVTTIETPSRSLAGFSRIHLRPQGTKTVTFRIRGAS
jgi:beta-glucosidase